jgi:uncharacterized membrane protein
MVGRNLDQRGAHLRPTGQHDTHGASGEGRHARLAALVAVLGAVVLALGYVPGVPRGLALLGVPLLVGGCIAVGVISGHSASRRGIGRTRAIFGGFRTAIAWILSLLP